MAKISNCNYNNVSFSNPFDYRNNVMNRCRLTTGLGKYILLGRFSEYS